MRRKFFIFFSFAIILFIISYFAGNYLIAHYEKGRQTKNDTNENTINSVYNLYSEKT